MMKTLSLRILATLIALMLIVSLTACGGTGDVDSNPTTESSQAESDSTTSADQNSDSTSRTKRSTATGAAKAKTWDEIKAMIPASANGVTLRVYDWNPRARFPAWKR